MYACIVLCSVSNSGQLPTAAAAPPPPPTAEDDTSSVVCETFDALEELA